jgi:hypothetical protein
MATQFGTTQAEEPTRTHFLCILVAHTHWDRAWYLPFEQFRVRLMRLIDRLLDMLERDPDYSCFMLDGQMVVVEDYLQIRPEQQSWLERLIREGRILIGPWCVLPDEFLVSPESLIRNLQVGLQMASDLGGGMRVGYEPDAFGHIAQLPQILAGFGIDNVVFWRGLGDEARELGTPFCWTAPDGTQALAVWLAGHGYSQFNYLGYPARGDEVNMPFSLDRAVDQIREGIEDLRKVANTRYLLLMAGEDGLWVADLSKNSPPLKAPDTGTNLVASYPEPVAIASPTGRGGIYVAYCNNASPCSQVELWRYGDKKAVAVPKSLNPRSVALSAGPSGRLWIAWWSSKDGTVRVVRTNEAGTRYGPVETHAGPPGCQSDGNGTIRISSGSTWS